MINVEPTSYKDINQVITYLAEGISEILQENLIGIYLFGSLTYGDFNNKRSDIDLTVILKNSATKPQLVKLEELHKEAENKYPKWKKRIENSYTPQNMLSSLVPPGARPYYGEGVLYSESHYGNEWIINLYLLYNHGIAILGPKCSELLQPIKIKDVQEACIKDLFKEWEPKLREQEWLDNSHCQSYLVLNLCRILNTVINATVLSKKKSATWVKEKYPHQWKELIQTAEDWHYGIEMKQKKEALEFLQFVIGKVSTLQKRS